MDAKLSISDPNKIAVTKITPAVEEVMEYDYAFLLSQRAQIQLDMDNYIKARQTELDEVNRLITQCESLGVKLRVDTIAEGKV